MRTTGEVRWCASLDDDVRSGTAAWIVRSSDHETRADMLPNPNAVDLAEIGARRGREADRFLQRRLTLRRLVGRWCGVSATEVVIGYDVAGRPTVRQPADGPRCSVTARGDVSGFALAEAAVGIDLEPVAAGDIAWAVLSPRETVRLRALDEPDRAAAFLELWTVKEAYLKALGTGLLRDPAELTVSHPERHLHDGDRSVRLSASACRHDRSTPPAIIAACISLPSCVA